MKTWVISDTHWNHEAMVELCGRPKNFNQLIVKNWKHLVGENDLVIHLGDVIFNRAGELSGIMNQLPGTKVLTLGNHDKRKPEWYMSHGFALACEQFVYKGITFSHYPLSPEDMGFTPLSYRKGIGHSDVPGEVVFEPDPVNIHGHFHNTDHRNWELDVYEHNKLFSLEKVGYKPVLLEQFIADE